MYSVLYGHTTMMFYAPRRLLFALADVQHPIHPARSQTHHHVVCIIASTSYYRRRQEEAECGVWLCGLMVTGNRQVYTRRRKCITAYSLTYSGIARSLSRSTSYVAGSASSKSTLFFSSGLRTTRPKKEGWWGGGRRYFYRYICIGMIFGRSLSCWW